MKDVNLLVIEPYQFLPAVYGGKKAIEQLYSHMGTMAALTIVSVESNDESFARNYQLIKLFSDRSLRYVNVFNFFKLKRLIAELKITHLIIEHPYMGWMGFLLQRSAGVKLVVRSQNIEAIRFKTFGKWWWKGMWLYEKWVHRKADMSFFITDEDEQFAIEHYQLSKRKCSVITFGINQQAPPFQTAKPEAKQAVCARHGIPVTNRILLFNGDLGYYPNEEAVKIIINEISPLLAKQLQFLYTLIICGKNLAETYITQIKTDKKDILYLGYVNDITEYVLAADIFINPVVSGGGIKTKLVEALSYNCNAVSVKSAATGIPADKATNKLVVVEDYDWKGFTEAIIRSDLTVDTLPAFYNYFYWGNIAEKALQALQNALP